jgi:hypothetical protein
MFVLIGSKSFTSRSHCPSVAAWDQEDPLDVTTGSPILWSQGLGPEGKAAMLEALPGVVSD